jgi:hypothetical protein
LTCLFLAPQAQRNGLHSTAALIYKAMFVVDPNLADDLASRRRYDAARAAVLAASAPRQNDLPLDDTDCTDWREQALLWLKHDLAAWKGRLKKGNVELRSTVRETLIRWQTDSEFASVRGPEALALLPDKERKAWSSLWQHVNSFLNEVQGGHP